MTDPLRSRSRVRPRKLWELTRDDYAAAIVGYRGAQGKPAALLRNLLVLSGFVGGLWLWNLVDIPDDASPWMLVALFAGFWGFLLGSRRWIRRRDQAQLDEYRLRCARCGESLAPLIRGAQTEMMERGRCTNCGAKLFTVEG